MRVVSFNRNQIVTYIVFIIFLLFALTCVLEAYFVYPPFDGTMNLQVPDNLIKYGRYATSFDTLIDFDPKIQSGVPLLLPIYFVMLLFGKNLLVIQLVSGVYLFLAIYFAYRLVELNTHKYYALALLILLIATPTLMKYGHHVYGEIPSLCFLLWSLLLTTKMEKGNATWTQAFFVGLLYGLACLTKTVMLIAVPSILAVAGCDLLFFHRFAKRSYLFFIFGFLITIFLFEGYKLLSLGGTAYWVWWQDQVAAIMAQAGVKRQYADTDSFLLKLSTHFKLFSNAFHFNAPLAVIFLITPHLIFFWDLSRKAIQKKTDQIRLSLGVVHGTAITYFAWWLCITPTQKAWDRRILDGYILQEIAFVVALFILATHLRSKKEALSSGMKIIGYATLTVMAALFILKTTVDYRYSGFSFGSSPKKMEMHRIAQSIASLPQEAQIFGIGWWQAPGLAFLSDRMFLDLKKRNIPIAPTELKDVYLAIDSEAHFLGKQEILPFLENTQNTLVARAGNQFLYQIHSIPSNWMDGSKSDIAIASFMSADNIAYPHVKGLYPAENGFRWSATESSILLKNQSKSHLNLKLFFPPGKRNYANTPELVVRINNEVVQKFEIQDRGVFQKEIRLPAQFITSETMTVALSLNEPFRQSDESQDQRNLAFILTEIGFK